MSKDLIVSHSRLNKLKSSPQKVNLVLKTIRNKNVLEAVEILSTVNRKVAFDIKKLLLSSIANLNNLSLPDLSVVYVKTASVGLSTKLRRFHPRGRGKMSMIEKKYSNVYLEFSTRG